MLIDALRVVVPVAALVSETQRALGKPTPFGEFRVMVPLIEPVFEIVSKLAVAPLAKVNAAGPSCAIVPLPLIAGIVWGVT